MNGDRFDQLRGLDEKCRQILHGNATSQQIEGGGRSDKERLIDASNRIAAGAVRSDLGYWGDIGARRFSYARTVKLPNAIVELEVAAKMDAGSSTEDFVLARATWQGLGDDETSVTETVAGSILDDRVSDISGIAGLEETLGEIDAYGVAP